LRKGKEWHEKSDHLSFTLPDFSVSWSGAKSVVMELEADDGGFLIK
jgi:hypothetical protein